MSPSTTAMLVVECHELTVDEQLALASALSDGLQGDALALARGEDIVFDVFSGTELSPERVERLILGFVSRRKESEHYSLERSGETIIIRSPDPLARGRGRKEGRLPDNLLKCPFCPFVTPYQEAYTVHVRSHGFGVL